MREDAKTSLGRGKWATAGVPHRDWRCVDEYDTFAVGGEDSYETCEMCETMTIRFVHVMEHDAYDGPLHCGCVCAGHMEMNTVRAEQRDKKMRQRAGRRAHFPDRKAWKTSARGTPYIKVDGFHLMVVRRKGGFVVGVTSPSATDPIWGKRTYATERLARFGCFDALEHFRNATSE